MMKKTLTWIILLLLLFVTLAAPTRAAMAQTEPEPTPQEGYPPPATPAQPEAAYPNQTALPTPTNNAPDAPYVAPTTAVIQPASTAASVIGTEFEEETAVPPLPISQSTLVRNRAILWAGFLITLLIFFTAVYGAMLMYTRRR